MADRKTVYVLTCEYNDYDQYGRYFCCVFDKKPTVAELAPILTEFGGYLPTDMGKAIALVQHYLDNKGRTSDNEGMWFNLERVNVR